ncbi:MAG: hypothetical protein NT062_04800 [Proteobacteria bacterium]|nr:hypothetical protein [Pseudomonadota bacterium]
MRAPLLLAGLVGLLSLPACGRTITNVRLTDEWPASADAGDYEEVTRAWTRETHLRGVYQEALEVMAVFKSPEWYAAHAARTAIHRGLVGTAREQHLAQARAEAAGPYELELLVTTWDRRENDLDRGKKSVWRVVMLDEGGAEIEPLEILRDKRPAVVVRAEFPELGEFATPYIVRFARTTPLLGPGVRQLRMRMSSERGGVELVWTSR